MYLFLIRLKVISFSLFDKRLNLLYIFFSKEGIYLIFSITVSFLFNSSSLVNVCIGAYQTFELVIIFLFEISSYISDTLYAQFLSKK